MTVERFANCLSLLKRVLRFAISHGDTIAYKWIMLLMRLPFSACDIDGVCACTSLTAHIRAMDPMLLVMVTSVALARSSLLMLSRFSLLIM